MKRTLSTMTALVIIFIAGITVPGQAVAAAQLETTQSIDSYCDATLYACNGYQPLSDEQFLPPWAPAFKNVQGFYHNDLAGLYRFPSYAVAINRDNTGNATSVIACSDIASSSCVGTDVHFRSDLSMCSEQVTIDCLRDIAIGDANDKPLAFSIIGQFPLGNPQYFKGSPGLKVPNGGGPTLIRIPDAPHNGGDTYLIKAQMTGSKWQSSQTYFMDSFAISITAVKITDGKYAFGGASTNPALYSKGFSSIGIETGTYPSFCAAASPTQCAVKFALPVGLKFGLTVDLSRKVAGWLHGRIKAPELEVSLNKMGGSTVKVKAEPIKIPVNAVWVNNETAPQSIKDFYVGKPNSGSPLFGNENKSKPLSEIALMRDGNTGHNVETLKEYLTWLATLGDKAQALPTAWSIQTMSNYQVSGQLQECLNKIDSLAGIVTTNAAEYLDGPPSFEKSTGTLDYKVAATHYEPDGKTVFKGTYDLVMNSTVARCIYGFTNAPVSATVSITSDDSSSSAATTVVKESAGWLSLSAYNFTYSSPVIRIKLSGTAITPKLIPLKANTKKITCVKGKIVKSVTSAKCPTGYSKRK